MSMTLLADEATGGLQVIPGGTPGGLVTRPGQVQYGDVLMGADTTAGWRELVGWRDTPEGQVSDSLRPQAHGAYPGDVWGNSLVVTFTYLLRGSPEDKLAALATLEKYAPMDGTERCLAVDDGDGTWCRQARVIGRHVPQGIHFRKGPVECSLQFLCADPRRYTLASTEATVTLPASSGGLEYPLAYPLEYGESATGSLSVFNRGSVDSPLVARFVGPLTNPELRCAEWSLAFDLALADGDTLEVDTGMGTALLNGAADRLYTLTNHSTPLVRCQVPPGALTLSLIAAAGTGRAVVTYRDARM